MKPMTMMRAAACLSALCAAPALAQDDAATPAPSISGVPAPTVAEADAAAVAPDAGVSWPVMCGAAGDPSTCVALQALGVAETDQRLLTVMVQSDGAEGENIILQLPHGILFPAGVQLQVDGGGVFQASLTTSDVSGAFAGATLTPELASAMQAGQSLTISFTSVEGEVMSFPVPLDGFSAAYDARRDGVATQ